MKKRFVGIILTSVLVVLVGVNTLALPLAEATPSKKSSIKQAPQLMVAMPVTEPSKPTKFDELLSSAEQGNAEAQFNLAFMYQKGKGVPQNYQKAIYWYQKSAEQGAISSQHNLGVMYDFGQGVPQNYQKAIYWYKKSAEQGYATSQKNLGILLAVHCKNLPQDAQQAYIWLSLAASQGEENASNGRDKVAETLTPEQLAEAQEWAESWQQKINAKKAKTPE